MSWRQVLAVAVTDARRMLRRKDTIVWLLIMPLPYVYFFGVAFRDRPAPPTPVVVVAPEPDAAARRVIGALEDADYAVTVREAWSGEQPVPRRGYRVDLPPVLGALLVGGGDGEIAVWSEAGALAARRVQVLLQQAVLSLRAEGLARLAGGETVTPASFGEPLEVVPITVEAADWGERREIPSGFKQSIPGNMVMFVLMAVLITGAVRLLLDRQAGHLERLLVAPMPAAAVVLSQFVSLALLGILEAVYFLLLGRFAFGQSPGPHPLAVFAVLGLLVAAASGVGVLLGATLKTAKQAVAVALFVTLALSALGGCWWPVEILPAGMRLLALALPTGQVMHALVRLMVWHDAPATLLGTLLYMLAFTAVAATVAATTLRRRLS